MKLLGIYRNGNVDTTIYSDGTKERFTMDDEFKPDFAENMDIKLCNRCDVGCAACHEGSTPDGKLGDIMNEKFIDTLHPFQEVACLSGDTYVYNQNGAIQINELNEGDYIFDSDHVLRKVIRITKIKKDTFMLKGQRGIKIKCSGDHPFLSNNSLVKAVDIIGKKIGRLNKKDEENVNEVYTIDMSKYIHGNNPNLPMSVGGESISETEIRLVNNGKHIPRYININEDLMYLYGWFIAEGSTKGLVMHIDELDIANQLGHIWNNIFGVGYNIYTYEDKHSLSLELYSPSIIDALFIQEMSVGKGANNKSIGYLFHINKKEFIRKALLGLFDGDGCYRERNNKNNVFYVASLKTTSRKLAYEVTYLLAKYFGIYASIVYGVCPERKIDGRLLNPSEYYAIEIYGLENLLDLFPERFKYISPKKQQKIREDKFKSIEKTESEYLYDITLDRGSHIFPINGYVLTHNCGGGNILEHPDLIPFLHKLKDRKVITNITLNQIHFEKNIELVKSFTEQKLIYGLGISLVNPTNEFINKVKQFPNAVIHVINGIFTEQDYKALKDNELKLLILGYKDLRRGSDYLHKAGSEIHKNQEWLKKHIKEMINAFVVLSFDNLAIEQLHIKEQWNILSDDNWDEFYAGDDGTNTYYIDMVERKFARSSTSPFDKRYDLLDDVDEMFEVIRNETN